MGVLELCEKYFETRDVYKVFDLDKNALPKEIKKSYYQLCLKIHPDRVDEAEKSVATEKFKILSKLYETLSDKNKRGIYDEQGVIDDEDDFEGKVTSWIELYRKIFKPLTVEEIMNYEKTYKGSDLEKSDIKKSYLAGKGCINQMMNEVPFLQVEDEPRLQEIVRAMIEAEEVPEYTIFTKEPAQKRNRRHKKYARESKEAQKIKKKMSQKGESLEQQILQRRTDRETQFDSLMNKLMDKYADDDSKEFKMSKTPKTKKSAATKSLDDSLHSVKNGRVSKSKK